MDPNADQAEVLETLRELHQTQSQLMEAMETLSARVGVAMPGVASAPGAAGLTTNKGAEMKEDQPASAPTTSSDAVLRSNLSGGETLQAPAPASPSQRPGLTSRIVLTLVSISSPFPVLILTHIGLIPSKSVLTR